MSNKFNNEEFKIFDLVFEYFEENWIEDEDVKNSIEVKDKLLSIMKCE